jgi:DNA (cytosine-5)-methyltransferase 1
LVRSVNADSAAENIVGKRATAMMRREGFLGVKEAAELLDVSPNTIRAWGASGKIPEYRHPVNNYRLFKRTDLERILNRLRQSVAANGARKRGD